MVTEKNHMVRGEDTVCFPGTLNEANVPEALRSVI